MRALAAVLVSFSLLFGVPAAGALTLHPIGNFEQPTYVTSESNPGRLLIAQRFGKIMLDAGGQITTFADLTSLIGCPVSGCEGERGLMSLALAPDFDTTGHFYVFYSNNSDGQIHIDELTAEGDVAPLSSRRPVLTIAHSDAANHNGGQLQFGPEGDLYISTGDGGGSNDEFHNSQNLSSLLGKILRIDPRPSGSDPYSVPADNPFAASAAPADTVWSYGLRNPFRFSFDRLTGNLVIGDVGQSAREEVDYAPQDEGGGAGTNWGWNCREGFIAGPATDLPGNQCTTTSFAEPIFDYPHEAATGPAPCAIIGGYVVRDPSLGDLYGRYLYGDLCVGELRSLVLPATGDGLATGDRSEGLTVENLNSFGEDSCGRLYTVSGNGEVARLEGPTPSPGCPPEEKPPTRPPPSPPPHTERVLGSTHVRLRAEKQLVTPGSRATLTAKVGPCAGRAGQRVVLNRGGARLASARLDKSCAAVFRPQIARRGTFRALVPASAAYLSGRSGRVTIDVG